MKAYFFFKVCLIILALSLITGCSTGGASHLPNIFQLPGAIIGSGVENSAYNAHRRKVESYVVQHYENIRSDAQKGGGQYIENAMDIAGIKAANRERTRRGFIDDYPIIFRNTELVTENLINQFTKLYLVNRQDKRIHGLRYDEALNIIQRFTGRNFEALRQDIGRSQTVRNHARNHADALADLATQLQMTDPVKRRIFIKNARLSYRDIYLNPVVVALMINR
jgi:hypothetical protein